MFANNDHFAESDDDCFSCFCQIRDYFPDIIFLSKRGQRKGLPIEHGVRYGRWFRRLSITPGKHADRKDLVPIFDDKDENIVSTENG